MLPEKSAFETGRRSETVHDRDSRSKVWLKREQQYRDVL